jgi:hypothetical protein
VTPAPRLAVYGAPPILAALEAVGAGRTDGDQSRTARLAVICERHDAIVADACPALTAAEWGVILDVRNGAHLLEEAGAMSGPATVAAEIEDLLDDPTWASRHRDLTVEDVRALAQRLATTPFANRVAVVEIAQRWWARHEALPGEVAAGVRAVGGRVA